MKLNPLRCIILRAGEDAHPDAIASELSSGIGLAVRHQLPSNLRKNQIHRLPRLAEHLKQHLRRFLEKLDPVAEIGGMALDLAADLQPITQQHCP